MKIATVIPFKRGMGKNALSYFSSREVKVGDIVSAPVRKKNVEAIVTSVEDVMATKAAIKGAAYGLRRLTKIRGPSLFHENFFEAAAKTADYFAAGLSETLDALLPDVLLANYEKIISLPSGDLPKGDGFQFQPEKLIFQAPLEDRLAFYRTAVRESFARGQSLFICLPSAREIEHFSENLRRGIEEYVFTFHGEMPPKTAIKNARGVLTAPHPALILGTPPYLCLPRLPAGRQGADLSTIVLEHESSPVYRQLRRPYLDLRIFTEIFAAHNRLRLIAADGLLRLETLHRAEQGKFSELAPILFRQRPGAPLTVVDMKKEDEINRGFTVLSRELKEAVRRTMARGERMFIFNLRKGLAPLTVCRDCRNVLFCTHCSAPAVLYEKTGRNERVFFCNRCRRTFSAETLCKNCGGWNLEPLGIGLERARAELKNEFPDLPLFVLERGPAQDFYKTPGAVLLGTEAAFSRLDKPIARSAVVSLDTLFTIPSFRIGEKILRLLLELRRISEESVILQTRNPGEDVLEHARSSNLADFCRQEMRERKIFDYPPFKRLIKITRLDSGASPAKGGAGVERERENLRRLLIGYKSYIFSGFIPKVRGKFITNAVLKIEPARWDLPELSGGALDARLLFLLKTLPPACSVQIDPEDLLN